MKQAWGTGDSQRRVRSALSRVAAGCTVLWPCVALGQEPAPTKASCAEAYESAQESRASGRLQETRQRLAFCARPECPGFVQRDCARWLEEVDRELPSIVVRVDGADSAGAQLQVDGKVVPDALGGQPLTLDPGTHELVLARPGKPPLQRRIMAQQGVQGRTVEFPLELQPKSEVTGVDAAPAAPSAGSPWQSYAYAAWGVGAVGFGTFAVLGTLGRADQRGLQRDCPSVTSDQAEVDPAAGVCLQGEFDRRKSSYERSFVIADVGLVTGIVGAAAGTALFLLGVTSSPADGEQTSSEASSLRLDVRAATRGAWAGLEGRF